MAMKRRGFLAAVLGALVAAPALWLTRRVLPARYTQALRARRYPGPVSGMDMAKVKRPGKWAG